MEANDYVEILKAICTKLDMEPNDPTLIRNVVAFCNQLNIKRLERRFETKQELLDHIAASYVEHVTPREEEHGPLTDYAAPTSNIALTTDWISERMPVLSSKSMSVHLNSRQRNTYSDGSQITDFAFALVPRSTGAKIGNGNILVRSMPSQVTYFKLGKIVLPYSAAMRARNYTNEMTMAFTALRSNGVVGATDTFHFAFTIAPCANNTELVELTPVTPFCKFSPPLRIVDDLTMRFADPNMPIVFDMDRQRASLLQYTSSDGRITFPAPHQLVNGSVVIVDGLRTLDDAANAAMLASINDPRGIVVTVIDAHTIATNIDFTRMVDTDSTSLPTVLFYSKMFRVLMEIGHHDVSEM